MCWDLPVPIFCGLASLSQRNLSSAKKSKKFSPDVISKAFPTHQGFPASSREAPGSSKVLLWPWLPPVENCRGKEHEAEAAQDSDRLWRDKEAWGEEGRESRAVVQAAVTRTTWKLTHGPHPRDSESADLEWAQDSALSMNF